MRPRGVALCAIAVASCSAPHRGSPADGGGDDAAGPACGDGILEPTYVPPNSLLPESCDDGPLNGTPQSLCTKQCVSGQIGHRLTTKSIALDIAPTRAVFVHFANPDGIAYTNFDASGIHVIEQMLPDYANGLNPTVVTLKVASAPLALGRTAGDRPFPLWIETPTTNDPAPHMYYADTDTMGALSVHEVPYPFSTVNRPEIFSTYRTLLIIDQKPNPPYDLTVAMLPAPSGVPDYTAPILLQLAAPSQTRGVAIQTEGHDAVEDPQLAYAVTRVVQFFDDAPSSFVTIEARTAGADRSAYSMSEYARGLFPHRVTGGKQWGKGGFTCLLNPYDPTMYPALSHPDPIIVLTDTGDLYAWQPSATPNGESDLPVFAHVTPGSLLVDLFDIPNDTDIERFPLQVAWVFEPDGTSLYLVDSDCATVSAPSLRPQRVTGAPAWTTGTSPVIESFDAFDPRGVIRDSTLWAFPE